MPKLPLRLLEHGVTSSEAPSWDRTKILPTAVADLFKIGIGPSSSHTIGPMKAAATFVRGLGRDLETKTCRIRATAFGSLAWTGRGHATDKALILGLAGYLPDSVDPDRTEELLARIQCTHRIKLWSGSVIEFVPERDVSFNTVELFERHPNAMRFEAFDVDGQTLIAETWFSIGGGFIEQESDGSPANAETATPEWEFRSAAEILAACTIRRCSIADMVLISEGIRRSEANIIEEIDQLIDTMMTCIERGLGREGELPGGLRVRRRARGIFESLELSGSKNDKTPTAAFEYVSAFAMAVNEENAAGGRVVTAPTNGAAGVVPAVLRYYRDFCVGASRDGMRSFLLTAAAIGSIIKRNASISGAEVGCQGEVGSASAMASAGLAAALGGTNEQIENAAEIAMEHHLGMTCDPIAGLVQIPCIERNAFGAVKAISAAHLALRGDGTHRVSLDQVIETMRQTGVEMNAKYRETSRGGLAVNVPAC